jgi:hypothetical protein
VRAHVEYNGSGVLAVARLVVDPDTPPLCDRRGCPGLWPNRWRSGVRHPGGWRVGHDGGVLLYCSPDCADQDVP